MLFILAVSFVSLAACSLAAPVMTPQHGDITRVEGTELNNQGPGTKPNNVYHADGTLVSKFSSVIYIYHLPCLDVQCPTRNYAHNGLVVDGQGPKGDYGIAPVSHNLPSDIFPHKDDATKYSFKFNAGSQISTGAQVRANPANMNKTNQQLGSIGSKELGDLKDKIGMSHFSLCITLVLPQTYLAINTQTSKAPLFKGSKDDAQVKSKAAPAPKPKDNSPLAPLRSLNPATGGKKGSRTI